MDARAFQDGDFCGRWWEWANSRRHEIGGSSVRRSDRAFARALVSLRVHVSLQACAAFSRSVYKDHRFLESDPTSWPAQQSFMARPTKERVTRNILITAMHCTM